MRLPDTFALSYTGGRWLALGGQSASDRMTRRRPAPSAQHPGPGKRRSTAPPLTLAEGRAGGPCRATKLTARGPAPSNRTAGVRSYAAAVSRRGRFGGLQRIAAIDQHLADAGCAHFTEDDFWRVDGHDGQCTSGQLSLAWILSLHGRVPDHPGTCLQSPTASVSPTGAVRFLRTVGRQSRSS